MTIKDIMDGITNWKFDKERITNLAIGLSAILTHESFIARPIYLTKMKYLFCIFSVFLFLSCKQTINGDLLIENVNIIDVQSGEVIAQQDVVITGNRIFNIGNHKQKDIQAKQVIDGKNKYLIPGLWDMHIHILEEDWYKWQLPLLRMNGIIGFREMWGDKNIIDSAKVEMRNSNLSYFHFVSSGHILDGEKPYHKNSTRATTPIEATRIVDSLANSKVDFIKIYSYLKPEVFYSIAKSCKEKKIPFAGHVPHTVWITSASKAGMASMEHLYGFLLEGCENSDSALFLMQQSVDAFIEGNVKKRAEVSRKFNSFTLANISKDKLRKIAQVLKANNTYIVPTLVTLRGSYFTNDTSFTNDSRLKYMSKGTIDYWKEETESDLKKNIDIDWQNKRKRWEVEQVIMKILTEEKVPIMAGTDSDNPYAFPGFSLHDEMALFVEFGMTPIEALRTSTLNPAKYLNVLDSLGTISEGKLADVVLLDANPIENIKNTTMINTVIVKGKIYGKDYFDWVKNRQYPR